MTQESTKKPIGILWLLVALGAVSTGWAIFLWVELVDSRSGGTPFCAVAKGFDCVALWDGMFASQIHNLTRIPVAGWGVAWGVVALLTPLLAIFLPQKQSALLTATRLNGVIGILALMLFIGASMVSGTFCLGCLVTYIVVSLYGLLALWMLRHHGFEVFGQGAGILAGSTALALVVMLYPGIKTPVSPKTLEKQAMESLKQVSANQTQGARPQNKTATQPAEPLSWSKEEKSTRLRGFLSSLPPPMLQGISNSILEYKTGTPVPPREPRAIIGDPAAKLRLTDFTDARCGHCAQLHDTLKEIYKVVPADSFNLEARHYPLDGACNKSIPRKSPEAEGCLAAKAQICLEGTKDAFAFAGQLFEAGRDLTKDMVWKISSAYMPKDKLESCVNAPETDRKLQEDIAYANAHNIHGTPLLLFNGRKAAPMGPFIFAMILSEGDVSHPAFTALPAPVPESHEGHNH